ncbi:MAG TPA: hypothetical protein VGP24_07985 [Glaciihabitans sp.]|jgi:hypothetical protein|nr:hypothetical protein [Glaciihabitans sp.]
MANRSRQSSLAIAAIAFAIGITSLSGCATDEKDDMLTLAEAKVITQTVEREIGSFVPADKVTLTDQHEDSPVLFDCATGHVWPGLLRLELAEGVDREAVTAAIAAEWGDKPGWSVEVNRSESGNPTVSISGSGGSLWSATFREQGREFRVTSYSPCFNLGADVDPGEIY